MLNPASAITNIELAENPHIKTSMDVRFFQFISYWQLDSEGIEKFLLYWTYSAPETDS